MRDHGLQFLGLALFLAVPCIVCVSIAQETVAFTDPDRVAAAMDHRPREVIAHLEAILTQEQADALEAALFPEPSAAEKVERLEVVKLDLQRLGFAEDDALVQAVTARIGELRSADEGVTP